MKPELLDALLKLNTLPAKWRDYASGDASALYRAGFEHCAEELESVLAVLTTALEDWPRVLANAASTPKLPFMKCLGCGRKTYLLKDIDERYCASCHIFHDLRDDGLTYELGRDA